MVHQLRKAESSNIRKKENKNKKDANAHYEKTITLSTFDLIWIKLNSQMHI